MGERSDERNREYRKKEEAALKVRGKKRIPPSRVSLKTVKGGIFSQRSPKEKSAFHKRMLRLNKDRGNIQSDQKILNVKREMFPEHSSLTPHFQKKHEVGSNELGFTNKEAEHLGKQDPTEKVIREVKDPEKKKDLLNRLDEKPNEYGPKNYGATKPKNFGKKIGKLKQRLYIAQQSKLQKTALSETPLNPKNSFNIRLKKGVKNTLYDPKYVYYNIMANVDSGFVKKNQLGSVQQYIRKNDLSKMRINNPDTGSWNELGEIADIRTGVIEPEDGDVSFQSKGSPGKLYYHDIKPNKTAKLKARLAYEGGSNYDRQITDLSKNFEGQRDEITKRRPDNLVGRQPKNDFGHTCTNEATCGATSGFLGIKLMSEHGLNHKQVKVEGGMYTGPGGEFSSAGFDSKGTPTVGHEWIRLDDGTIIDGSVGQFMDQKNKINQKQRLRVIPPNAPLQKYYKGHYSRNPMMQKREWYDKNDPLKKGVEKYERIMRKGKLKTRLADIDDNRDKYLQSLVRKPHYLRTDKKTPLLKEVPFGPEDRLIPKKLVDNVNRGSRKNSKKKMTINDYVTKDIDKEKNERLDRNLQDLFGTTETTKIPKTINPPERNMLKLRNDLSKGNKEYPDSLDTPYKRIIQAKLKLASLGEQNMTYQDSKKVKIHKKKNMEKHDKS